MAKGDRKHIIKIITACNETINIKLELGWLRAELSRRQIRRYVYEKNRE